jgi:TetR/AcrR family transcriptional regulator, regulator of autoinduction and epiphytic fitness
VTTGKRVYRSPLRAEQAERTRVGVLDAAARCFVARGYAGTTMRDIAEAAGVSVQTVFGQGSKAALLLACVDRAVVGDDGSEPLIRREAVARMLAAEDKADKLGRLREIALSTVPRTGPLLRAFASAAAVDPEIATAWADNERRRRQDYRAVVESFGPWLRADLTVDRAADVFWTVFDDGTAQALLDDCGWSLGEYCDWLVDSFDRLLLR